ncbi:MAG: N-acetylneuraminate synthase family protein [Pseudobdellovibrionaceae bacterium]
MKNVTIKIGSFEISATSAKVFIIAEIGNNHNGSFDLAIKMIDEAYAAGADCVKFQMRNMNALYRQRSIEKKGEDLSTEYILDLLHKFELTLEEHKKIQLYCEYKKILYLCTPWDLESLKVLESMQVQAYKVASADFTNIELLEGLAQTKKPLIISTGMTTEQEIEKVISILNNLQAEYVLLHCNSTYPAPFHGINLNYLKKLQQLHALVGYSGHERGTAVSIAAVALGAKVIERHFTLDRNMEGPDHAASLTRNDFEYLVNGIRELEQALGTDNRVVSQGELINKENLGKSLVAAKNLAAGTTIQRSDIISKSPGRGLSPLYLHDLIGKKLTRNLSKEDFFYFSDIEASEKRNMSFSFSRPWGIPVRYYDFEEMYNEFKPELVEFHLSYSDMDLKIEDYFKNRLEETDFVVHAPELFSESRLMDLASKDKEYLDFSLKETQKVIDITRKLKSFFPKTRRPMIVANIGGFSRDAFHNESKKQECYEQFEKSLKMLDLDGVELIPQSMAPFPWHFGGQRFQNIFVHPHEIKYWCEKLKIRICLDISHSALVANYFNYNFLDFLNIVAPFTAHLHLGDSKGVDGEGLQIGDGHLNFDDIGKILLAKCPKASFIPEIWQGHKNSGEGFYLALKKLSGKL